MEKPFTLIVQETEQKIVEIVNKSPLPLFVIKNILQGLCAETERVDNEEITKYKEEQEKLSQEKEKESDK